MLEPMIRILLLSDPTVGVVLEVLEDETSSNGERIERLVDILASIWEEANGWEKSQPKGARSFTKPR